MADQQQSERDKLAETILGKIGSIGVGGDKAVPAGTATQDKTASEARYVQVGDRMVKRSPIGVDTGYVAPYQGQRYRQTEMGDGLTPEPWIGAGGVEARYDPTDLDSFSWLSPESVVDIQASLARAGLLDKYAKGIWDSTTGTAMAKVLAYANQRGLLWEDALDEWAAAGAASGLSPTSPRGPVFTPRLSNPDDLRKIFKQAAFQTLGGNFLSDDDYQRMVEQYQGAELSSQRAAFDAAVGGGGETVDAPNASTYAEDTLTTEQAPQAQAHSIMQYGQVFERLMGGA